MSMPTRQPPHLAGPHPPSHAAVTSPQAGGRCTTWKPRHFSHPSTGAASCSARRSGSRRRSSLTAICLLVILVVIGRFTEWGRQFWRVTGDYFTGRQSVTVWLLVALLLLSVIVSVRINVLLTYYVNDLFTALQVAFQSGPSETGRSSGIAGFWATMAVFAVLAVLFRRAVAARHVRHPAVHHAMANLVEPPLHRRLARRSRLLPCAVLRQTHRQPGPADPAGHRRVHRRCRRRRQQPDLQLQQYAAVRCRRGGAVGAVVRAHPVAAVRTGDASAGSPWSGPCSGSSSSTCWRPPSSRSSSDDR